MRLTCGLQLSHQLSLMKAELESNISKSKKTKQENEMENYTADRNDVLDSRLSTVLFLPSFTSPIRNTPTPPPTHNIVPKVAIENQLPITPSGSFCENFQGTKCQLQRQPMCIPSSSEIIPQIQHKNKVTRLGGTSLRNLSNDIQLMRKRAVAPPKPKRTFMEAMNKPRTSNFSVITKTSAFLSSPIIILPRCSHEEFLRIIQERFQQGHCWFCRAGELFFVNPFNNISSTKSIFYRAISSISISLFEHENAALIFRGLPGSGKSKLSEMVCLELVDRLDSKKEVAAILCSALLALRPFLTTNKKYNNQSSRAVHHYEINIRDSRLSRIILRHFLIDTPSRHCRANIFAMLANDMNEQEKEKLRISAFHLREKYANYGNLNDVQRSLKILGLPVNDIFKVLSACTLLNNLIFKNMKTFIDIENLPDLEDASHLLGVSVLSLYRTLMSSTFTNTGSIHECENKRDEFVSAIYSRLVKAIHDKANSMLSTLLEASDNDNSFNDSGINLGSPLTDHVVHIIDAPGYVCNYKNSLPELLINTTNDYFLGIHNESTAEFLKKVEGDHWNSEKTLRCTSRTLTHCNGQLKVNYNLQRMYQYNKNSISRDLVSLFDARSCSSQFVVKLFAVDVRRMKVEKNFGAFSTMWSIDEKSVIRNVLECTKSVEKVISKATVRSIICLKQSNEHLEFARLQERTLMDQLSLFSTKNFENIITFSQTFNKFASHSQLNTVPAIPALRTIEFYNGKKHMFPQRRNIIVDFHDKSSGINLRAGEIVRALGFHGEFYIVETGNRTKAVIPIAFTEKSLPPTEGYCV